MSKIIDLRSETITVPDDEMREAMRQAIVGDDILGEDPTVQELESRAAKILGKEASLLVISGTMANQVAVMSFTERGQEIIVGQDTHIYNLEVAGMATLSQVQARPVCVTDGYYSPDLIEEAIQPCGIQRAETGLICLENTYNLNEGHVVTLENIKEIRHIASQHNIPLYLDGARLFNATAYLGIDPAEMCQYVDAVQICLTKGLGAPLGSILAGSSEFVEKAKWLRQRIGGGMRQAGVIAAPGLIALTKMDRLAHDHARASILAKALAQIDGLELCPNKVLTNIISPIITKDGWDVSTLLEKLEPYHIKVKPIASNRFRMITHLQITDEDVEFVLNAFHEIFN